MTTSAGFGSDIPLASRHGDVAGVLFATLYTELHRLAKQKLARQAFPITMGATTLLHRSYIEIAGRKETSFPDQSRFIGYASQVMRGLIVDHIRNRHAQKRGSLFKVIPCSPDLGDTPNDDKSLLLISEALDELEKVDSQLVEIVTLKFFCGFSFTEIATMRNVSERTVQRAWEKARIYLHQSIRPDLLA